MIFRKSSDKAKALAPSPEKMAAIAELHQEIDNAAAAISASLGDRLHCQEGCADCCVDDITVFAIEADLIRDSYPELLADGKPHQRGKCAFLSETESCRIYQARPYVCRTQGLPLRWQESTGGGDESSNVVEYRDICPLNESGPALETLSEGDCWQIGPVEEKLRRLMATGYIDPHQRQLLRSLFKHQED